jgi:hypothetical protein
VLRSLPEDDSRRRERTRKYLRDAFSGELAKDWEATFRSGEDLSAAALSEAEAGMPGPATRELAARSAYPLVVDGRLTGDRGSKNNDQPDRRHPGEVIDLMRTTPRGVHQLRQALVDFGAGRRIRMVDDTGQAQRNAEGRDIIATDADLRRVFYPPGEGPAPVPAPKTPAEILGNALNALGTSIQAVQWAVKQVEAVQSDDGTFAIESLGASPADCDVWQGILFGVLQKLPIWKERSAQRYGLLLDKDLDEDLGLDGDDDLDGDADGVVGDPRRARRARR